MKKIILLFLSALVLTTFNSCNQNDPLPDTDKESTEQGTDDPKDNTEDDTEEDTIDPLHSTTVTICSDSYTNANKAHYSTEVVGINIYNASGVKVGNGSAFGEYLVPYYGSIAISYKPDEYRISMYHDRRYSTPTDTYEVGTASKLKIVLYAKRESSSWKLYSQVE